MRRSSQLIITVLLLLNGYSLFSQVKKDWSLDQLVEQEKNRFVQSIRNNANGLTETTSSSNFNVHYYRCEWQVDPAVRFIRGKVTSAFSITNTTGSIVYDLLDSLTVDSIYYHNAPTSFTRPGNHQLAVNFPASLNAGATDSVSIYYHGAPPSGTGFGAFSVTSHAGVPVIWTLSEPYGAREWWPCKNGLDDKADSLDVIITIPDIYFAASNGILANETVSSGMRTVYWKHRYPIASYLVAFATTNYQVQNDTIQLNNTVLPLNQYVYPEGAAAFAASINFTRRTMRLYENAFGPYPFRKERYAHTQCGFGGGMEHQTNSFMGGASESLLIHELGHQWFGDRVTCGSWQDIWLNEGFATFMANYSMESFYPPATTIPMYKAELNSIVSQPGGSVFVTDTTNIGRIFSYRLTYAKGAWLLQMLRWKLGDSAFFKGLRSYLADASTSYAFGRTDDLKRNLEIQSGQNLAEFFKDWYYGEGYPSYQLDYSPIGSTHIRLTLSQTTSHPSVSFFEMPVPIRFKNAVHDTLIVIDHTINGQSAYLNLGFIPDTAIIDPDLKLISANNKVTKTIDNSSANNTVSIFPNPVGSQFSILLRNFSSQNIGITVHNSAGQLIWKEEKILANGSEFISVQSAHWSEGIYWLSIRSKDFHYVKKIMK